MKYDNDATDNKPDALPLVRHYTSTGWRRRIPHPLDPWPGGVEPGDTGAALRRLHYSMVSLPGDDGAGTQLWACFRRYTLRYSRSTPRYVVVLRHADGETFVTTGDPTIAFGLVSDNGADIRAELGLVP